MTAEERIRDACAALADALVAATAERAPTTTAPIKILDIATFARRAGLGRSTAYLLVADGTVHSVKIRGRRLVLASELARLVESATPGGRGRP